MQQTLKFSFILILIFIGKAAVLSENASSSINSKESLRLPRNLIPKLYQLEVKPFLDPSLNNLNTFEGRVIISFNCILETDKIILHSKNLTIYEDKVKLTFEDDNKTPILIKQHEYDLHKSFYIIHLGNWMKSGGTYQIKIEFKGVLGTQLIGFYRASYNDSSTGEKRSIALTQLEPIYARMVFPGFDEPAFKAAFDVNVTRSINMTSVSNMPLKTTTDSSEAGWVTDHFDRTPPMSTYLVAFIVFDFVHLDSPDGKFRIWARKDALEQTKYALNIGPKIQKYFEEYFGIPFPLPKQDLVAVPDFYHGAMENFGLITFREAGLLYDVNKSSDGSQKYIARTISHELSHQWFGNLVTMNWFDGLWLNEGFASYAEYIGVDKVEPNWHVMDFLVIEDMYPVFDFDSWNSSHPIWADVQNPDDIDELFDFISYKKGCSVIRMMANFLTEHTMKNGLSSYLRKWMYNNTDQEDLWDSLTEQAHKDNNLAHNITVKEIMDTWTMQKGFPVVHVQRSYEGQNNKVTFTQKIFTHSITVENPNSTWWIPISYSTPEINSNFQETRATHWLVNQVNKPLEVEINIKPDQWLMVNIQETGFYRVNYDTENWMLIKSQLTKDFKMIHLINRAQIVNDIFNIARESLVSYELAFSVTEFIQKDTEYVPWSAYLATTGYINAILSATPVYGEFKKYMRNQLRVQYDQIGFHILTPGKTISQKLHRAGIIGISCYYGVEKCIEFAKQKFFQWMNSTNPDSENNIRKNFRGSVYCTSLRFGGQTEWDFLWQRYLNSKTASERNVYISALSCSREVWILNRYLKLTITPEGGIGQQHVTTVLAAVSRSTIGSKLTLEFLDDNWDSLFEKLGKPGLKQLDGMFTSIAGRLCTPSELKQFESVKGKKDFGPATLSVNQGLERIKTNIAWMKTHYSSVSKWLMTQQTNI